MLLIFNTVTYPEKLGLLSASDKYVFKNQIGFSQTDVSEEVS